LRQIALLEGIVMAASKLGKWKTGIQITAIIVLLLNNFPFNFIDIRFDIISSWAAVIITVYSGVDYFVKNKHVINFSD
jgi:CDP-diacylglycerol---glycerol-3-phosphate 3-phosphatidyltransferase